MQIAGFVLRENENLYFRTELKISQLVDWLWAEKKKKVECHVEYFLEDGEQSPFEMKFGGLVDVPLEPRQRKLSYWCLYLL